MDQTARWAALAGVGLAGLVSFGRTFNGWEWLIPSATGAVLAALTAHLLSKRFWRLTAVMTSCVMGAWFIMLVIYPTTTVFGVPTLKGVRGALDAGLSAWDLSKEAIAPIDALPGLLVLILAGSWMASATAAVTLTSRASLLAVLPWTGLFTYSSAVGIPQGRVASVFLFTSSLVVFLYVTSTAQRRDPSIAARAGVIAVVGALIAAPLLPGYGDPPMVALGPVISAQGTRLAPFEFISAQLRDDEETVMFKVRADRAAYWRLAALDHYDGKTWAKGLDFGQKVPLRRTSGSEPETVTVRQRYTIHGLRGQWVPAAFRASMVQGLQVLNDPIRDTVYTDDLSSRQSYYTVSSVPAPTRTTLESALSPRQTPLTRRYMRLPEGISSRLYDVARTITQNATTPYGMALAIQDQLRSFDYSLEPPRIGHSDDDLVRFLTEKKEGYCENFAGAMAVLLRTLGIPSRVAIGFLPGKEEAGTFTVLNTDAHAWTEVWFEGIGWVPFEPTPRSEATPPSYASPADLDPGGPVDPETVHPGRDDPVAVPSPDPVVVPPIEEPSSQADIAREAAIRTAVASFIVIVLLVVIKAAWVRLPYLRAKADPRATASAAFRELEIRGSDAFRPRAPHETELEFVDAIGRHLSLDRTKVEGLIGPHLKAFYSNSEVSAEEAAAAVSIMRQMRSQMARGSGPGGRLKMGLDPGAMISEARKLVQGARRW